MTTYYRALPETGNGHRLGRHVHHDSRSASFPAELAPRVVSVTHQSYGLPLDQGQVGCHDDQTDVLTADGWQRWPDYDGCTALGTVNPVTRILEFQEPSAVQAYEYSGPMFGVGSSTVDFSVTPNHRMWVRRWNEQARTLGQDFRFTRMDEIGWYSGLLAAPFGYRGIGLREIGIGPHVMAGNDFVALTALVASDGWVGGTDDNLHRVSFCCFREDRREKVAELAHRLGFTEQPSRPGAWYADRPALAEWFRANLYAGTVLRSPYKHLPGVIRHLDQRQTALFLDFYGDQHVSDDGRRQFYTTSTAISDGLQELLLRTGSRPGTYTRAPRTSVMQDGREVRGAHPDITVTEWTGDRLSIERKRQVTREDYQGGVYCATVPNGILVTRRNGKVLISGNSCTAEALTGCLNTAPDYAPGPGSAAAAQLPYDQQFAYDLYAAEVALEGGHYPPDDPGGSGLTVCQVAKNAGLISSYAHVFSAGDALKALVLRPGMFGVSWYTSMDSPDGNGVVEVTPAATVRGGHEVFAYGVDADAELIWFWNSWGPSWGLGGRFAMSFATAERLLSEDGDMTFPVK